MRISRNYLWVLILLMSAVLHGQTDSLKTLSSAEFMEAVGRFHPVARQASLLPRQALAELQIARGGFDPLLYSNYNNKVSDGVNYYSYFESQIKLPAWYGIEVKAGYDVIYGQNINPEDKLPADGLGYLGINVSLLKNLVIDKRRAALKQAQIFREVTQQQQISMLNDLLFEAITAYYDWWLAYRQLEITKSAVNLAAVRFEATKTAARLGDRPTIDTVEALTQLQSRELQFNDALLSWRNRGLELSNFLWLDNEKPVAWSETILPADSNLALIEEEISFSNFEQTLVRINEQHPDLLAYRLKLKQLDVERRLKIENLKPTLNAGYNIISSRFSFPGSATDVLGNNYKLGVNFSMPLTFAQGRGELKLTRLKITDTRYALDLKMQELRNKAKSAFNELLTIQQQNKLYKESTLNFRRLFEGEIQRFNNGESSLFLVNARENRYIDAALKLSEIQAKFFTTEAKLKWTAAGFRP